MGSRGFWAFMGARTKRTLTVSWTGLFVLSLLMQYFAFTVAAPDALATVQTGLIQIQKFANPWGPVNAGDEIGFDITVTNNSALPATNVHVVDELDPRFAWVLAPNTADDCRIEGAVGSQTLVCDDALMVPGDFFTVHVSAQTTAATCGLVENIASVTTAEPGFHQHEAIVEILCPELSVLKTADHDEPVTVGDQIGFTVTLSNAGNATASDARVSDTLPAGFDWTIESQSGGWSLVDDVLSWGPDDLAAGGSATVHVVSDTDGDDCGPVPNTAILYVGGDGGTQAGESSAAEEVLCSAELDLSKTADHEEPVVLGDEIGFTITASNSGDGTATDIHVSDALDSRFSWSIESQSGALTWTLVDNQLTADGDLPPGTSSVHVVATTPTQDTDEHCGLVPNTAFMTQGSGQGETPVDEASASEEVLCANPPPGLGIVKSNDAPITTIDGTDGPVDLPTAEVGDTVTYTLTYNTNGVPQSNGVITDVLPDGITYVGGTATNNDEFTFVSYTDATRTLRWEAPTVTEGGSLTYDVTIDEDAPDLPQPLINVATIVTDDQPAHDDDSPVFAAGGTLDLTPPPTDTLAPSAPAGTPGFALMLILLSIAGLALVIGFITPVPERVRRRDRLG